MSIIKSPYEISIWKDEIVSGRPREQKICVIGSDKMTSQSRATAPNFIRCANGEKKLSFQMYKQYIDITTGEKVHNPFVDLIANETKIKLYYEDKWHDFIVKDINENSSNYLCSYTLEDALVKELSRNGFGVTLDAALNNNLGDVETLANYALAETDWTVDSEVFVEKVEEALVYLQTKEEISAVPLLDQTKDADGKYSDGVVEADKVSIPEGATILAFYSSCKNKPYRFQFIYNSEGYDRAADGTYKIERKDTRVISQANCQYYIEVSSDNYLDPNVDDGTDKLALYLPNTLTIGSTGERWDPNTNKLIESDSQISSWYRGERYGYAPQSVYVPMLEKYCQKFKKNDGVEYLHYVESKFVSPTLVQNVINNYTFESKNGWYGQSGGKAENIYACHDGSKFKTVIEAFEEGDYDAKQPYKGYMKITTSGNGAILNSGLRDNRTMIKNMSEGEEWILDYTILNENNSQISSVNFSIGEYIYNPDTGDYVSLLDTKITFEQNVIGPNRIEFKVKSNQYTEDTFKDSSLYLKIQPRYSGTYYIEKIALYRKSLDKQGQIISPDYEYKIEVDEEGNIVGQEISDVAQHFIDTGVVENRYIFFPADEVNSESQSCVKTAAELTLTTLDKMDYDTFVPVFNQGAKKIRTISIKESNYFNILQTIAETFESWLDLSIERDADGYVISKTVSFKNYLGEINHANFRYGVNLKDISRTSNSKNIVSKLIVKNNTNELGKDGFCTIQRAGSNPTGENYIYDFQYYHNQNLMDVNEYLNAVYYLDEAAGADYDELWLDKSEISEDAPCNLNGYNLRIKKINDAMQPISEEVVGLTQQLVDKQATQEVVKATNSAALTELEKIRTEFKAITGVYPENTSPNSVLGVRKSTKGNWYEKDPNQDWWTVPNANYNPFHLSLDMGTKVVSGDIRISGDPVDYERTARFKMKLEYRCRKYEINDGVDYLYGTYEFIDKPTNPFTTDLENSWRIDVSDGFYIDAFTTQELYGPLKNMQISYSPYDVLTIYYGDGSGSNKLAYTSSLTGISDTHYAGWQGEQFDGYPGTITFDKPFYVNNSSFYNWFLQNTELIREGGAITPNADIPLWIERTYDMKVTVAPLATKAYFTQKMDVVDIDSRTIQRYLTEYATCLDKERTSTEQLPQLKLKIEALEDSINTRQKTLERLRRYKKQLNHLFFKKYSNFISEGTWIDEKYTDDDKYYADAQSVLYNSCYPQVQYNVNVLFLSKLPGYELFKFELGDKTNVIDDDFFGKDKKQEVVITEITEVLDDPTQNSIKVQTFKNQFQDLFQKITATTQQTQYNSGSYEKGEKFLEATAAKQSEFITNAINSAQDYLRYGQTVTTGKEGITITDDSDKQSQLRLVGGAILFSTTDPETQEVTWATGLTNEGISASLITAGQLDTGLIQIMSSEGPTFRWDTYGLTAFDAYWSNIDGTRIIADINTSKFVRFDKHGIYGVNNYPGVKGSSWVPKDAAELDRVSTFSLTWDGLKVTGSGNIVAKIGRSNDSIIKITNNNENVLTVTNEGDLRIAGEIIAKGGTIGGFTIGKRNSEHPSSGDIVEIDALYYEGVDALDEKTCFNITPQGKWSILKSYSEEVPLPLMLQIGDKFGVANDGAIFATGANIAGEITAEKGKIGGFILEKWYEPSDGYVLRVGGDPTDINPTTGSITYDDGTFGYIVNEMLDPPDIFFCNEFPVATLSLGGSKYKSDWRLGIGSNFGVDKNGNVYAKDANLSGHINATSGTLGGLSINGSITLASGGSIVHNSSSCRWTSEGFSLGTGSIGTWAVRPESYYGLRINYVNGSSHPTSNYVSLNKLGIVKNRSSAALGDSEITWEALFHCIKAPRGGSTGNACLNTLEISNVTIDNSTLSSGVQLNSGVKLGSAWQVNTDDSLISESGYGTKNMHYYLHGNRLKSYYYDSGDHIASATWDDIIDKCKTNNTSDARLKNNIETFSQAYDTFFDALIPTRYQYINGTSGRYHTGFIAQEVVKALELAGLTTQDFAAVMLVEEEEGSYWQLRRDEFVSLNTWQIQLLKPRVAAIEEKISQLEAELAELKSKI